MDIHDPSHVRRTTDRAQREVRTMAGPGFVIVVVLMLVSVPVWALIWGRKDTPQTVTVDDDREPQRLEVERRAGR